MASGDDTRMGNAFIFLTREWKLSAADAWSILNPHLRAARNSTGPQGRRLKGERLKQLPFYRPRQGHELRKALNLFVLVELHRLRQADAPDRGWRPPKYTRDHRRLRRALNLLLLEKLHGMTRAKAWRALHPRSLASDESAAAEARRALSWYRELHARVLDPPARSEPDVPDDPPEWPPWVVPFSKPAVEPVEAWYARMLKEQADREIPEAWLEEADALIEKKEAAEFLHARFPGTPGSVPAYG